MTDWFILNKPFHIECLVLMESEWRRFEYRFIVKYQGVPSRVFLARASTPTRTPLSIHSQEKEPGALAYTFMVEIINRMLRAIIRIQT